MTESWFFSKEKKLKKNYEIKGQYITGNSTEPSSMLSGSLTELSKQSVISETLSDLFILKNATHIYSRRADLTFVFIPSV
ncbi:UNVERIFIED_CONTAM: hypothetical protein NCL1_11904 [Trichonephila clavipes]